MANRRYAIKFSGASQYNPHDKYHDGKMTVSYCYMISNAQIDKLYTYADGYPLLSGEVAYSNFLPGNKTKERYGVLNPLMFNYTKDATLGLSTSTGGYLNNLEVASSYSIYRREYDIYQKPGTKIKGYYKNGEFYFDTGMGGGSSVKMTPRQDYIYIDIPTQYAYQYDFIQQRYILTTIYKEFKGEWEPVVVNYDIGYIRDFNITAGRSYQYILYPSLDEQIAVNQQVFANASGPIFIKDDSMVGQSKMVLGSAETSHLSGTPVKTAWGEWSLVELIPQSFVKTGVPDTIKQVYKANLEQLWKFKFSLETGELSQNISRGEFQSLGQFPKMGYGKTNYASGSVTALLGSEIIPYSKDSRYIERLAQARTTPLSTNEKVEMLKQWKKLVYSKNPKLLKDMKGQSWIVQIVSSGSTVKNFVKNQPDSISFSWKQIDDPKNIIIYGDGDQDMFKDEGSAEWTSAF